MKYLCFLSNIVGGLGLRIFIMVVLEVLGKVVEIFKCLEFKGYGLWVLKLLKFGENVL